MSTTQLPKNKTCNTCSYTKIINDFGKESRNKDGYSNKCKYCVSLYRQENKDKIKETQKLWKLNNPNYFKEYSKQWKLQNPDYFKEYNVENFEQNKKVKKEYSLNNSKELKTYQKQYNIDNKEKRNKQSKDWKNNNLDQVKILNKNWDLKQKKKRIKERLELGAKSDDFIYYELLFTHKMLGFKFIKVGITSLSVKDRYSSYKEYSYQILNIYYGDKSYIRALEQNTLIENTNNKFKFPNNLKFGGYTECINTSSSLIQDLI